MPTGCQALTASGLNGGNSLQSLSQLGQQLGQMLQQLMQAGGGGGGGGGAGTGVTGSTGTACSPTTPSSDPTQVSSSPCIYYYSPAATDNSAGGSSNMNDLLQALLGNSGTTGTTVNPATGASISAAPQAGPAPLSVQFSAVVAQGSGPFSIDFGDGSAPATLSLASSCSSNSTECPYQATYVYQASGSYTATLLDGSNNTLATIPIHVSAAAATSTTGSALQQLFSGTGGLSTSTASNQSFANIPGVAGNIIFTQNGGTLFASTQSSNNSAVSGFFGSNTMSGGQSQGVISGLCQKRPWAGSFISDIIPPTFFDNLCQWGGFQVGTPAAQPQVTLHQSTPRPAVQATTSAATTQTTPAQAQIWAVPASVSLGARTSVYWNSQGVTSCTETSPDGSFSENSLSGAAATVPLTQATTFTISCTDQNGNPITNDVTVQISS